MKLAGLEHLATWTYSIVQYSTVQYDVKNVMEGRREGKDQARFFLWMTQGNQYSVNSLIIKQGYYSLY